MATASWPSNNGGCASAPNGSPPFRGWWRVIPTSAGALPWLERHLDHFERSTRAMDLVMRNGRTSPVPLDQDESAILAALAERPISVHELAARLNRRSWNLLDLDRLEDHYLIQRCALTPTDLLHATGQLQLWDERAARRLADLVARLQNIDLEELARQVMDQLVRTLAVELFKTQLGGEMDPDGLEKSPVAMAMINNLLDGGNGDYRVRVQLHHPIIGIGAPAHLFLPQAAQLLETEAILPLHADVANAIGAITSPVCIRHQLEISPTESETYYVAGLPNAPTYRSLEEAYQFSLEQLKTIVRERAKPRAPARPASRSPSATALPLRPTAPCCSSVACWKPTSRAAPTSLDLSRLRVRPAPQHAIQDVPRRLRRKRDGREARHDSAGHPGHDDRRSYWQS